MSEVTKPPARRPGWFYRWMMGPVGFLDRCLSMSCRSFIQLASAKYERPLRAGERMRHAMHRAMCRLCRTQERHMARLRALAREIGRNPDAEAKLSPEATERMRRAVVEAAARTRSSDRT